MSIAIYIVLAVMRVRFSIILPSIIVSWYKVLTAAFIVCICIKAFHNIHVNSIVKYLLNFSDKYSYTVYLAHHIFILGSLSLIGLTGNMLVDIVLAVMCAVTLGVGIEFSTGLIMECRRKT